MLSPMERDYGLLNHDSHYENGSHYKQHIPVMVRHSQSQRSYRQHLPAPVKQARFEDDANVVSTRLVLEHGCR